MGRGFDRDRHKIETEFYYTTKRAEDAPQSWRAYFGNAIVQAVSFRQLVYRLKDYRSEVKDGAVLIASDPLVVKHLGTELAPSVVLKMWLDERERWQGMANSFHSKPKGIYKPKSKVTRLKGTL